jgi:hypothetical protein
MLISFSRGEEIDRPEKDLLVGVELVDHQVEEPLHLGLKGELLRLLSHASLLSLS